MRRRGIHYDIGTRALDGTSTRPGLTDATISAEVADIAHGLHATAIRITGGDLHRMAGAAHAASRQGLEVWLSPMLPDEDASATLAAIEDAGTIAQEVRTAGGEAVLVVGCEVSTFMSGILPGSDAAARIALLSDPARLLTEVTERGLDPQAEFDAFIAVAARAARRRFDGPITYAAGPWEEVDWTRFEIVGVDAYRDAGDRIGYQALLESKAVLGRPLVVTEVGCATFRGAADLGSLGWTVVDRGSRPYRLRDDIVRDEAAQADELAGALEVIESVGADGVFVFTYIAPSYTSSDDPALDLDTASFALVRSWPDGRTARKAAFRRVAQAFASWADRSEGPESVTG